SGDPAPRISPQTVVWSLCNSGGPGRQDLFLRNFLVSSRLTGPGIPRDSVGDMAIMTRTLGGTGADVTILGYGAMELRGRPRGPEIADDDAGRLLNAVLDGGINLIDTSPDYGRSEELIGGYIGHRREEFFLASKCGCPLHPARNATPPFAHDYTAQNIRAGIERSLERLGT